MVLEKRRGTLKHGNVQYYTGYYRDTVTACLDIYLVARTKRDTETRQAYGKRMAVYTVYPEKRIGWKEGEQ